MPPQVSISQAFCTPKIPETRKHTHLKRMELTFTTKRFIRTFVFILACLSIFRLLRFAIFSYSSSPSRSTRANSIESSTFAPPNSNPITKKEYRFLSSIVSQRSPCNLLIFGWEPRYRRIPKMNAAGITVFLEDRPERIRMRRSNNTLIYKVNYDFRAKEAYEMLKHAREENGCEPNSRSIRTSTCKLAMTNLPDVVYQHKWDVIVVDGPSSDGPEAPGRMPAIYTASMLARAQGTITTNVVVHDVDRMIERWFSWEFLCHENLVSSKGRYWNFRIQGGKDSNSTTFCSQG